MSNTDFIKLPDSELEVMQAIWTLFEDGEKYISAGNIIKHFEEISRLKLTTVLTLITRLQSKGYVSIEKIGRSNCCKPLISRKDYLDFATRDFIERVYLGNTSELLAELKKASEV